MREILPFVVELINNGQYQSLLKSDGQLLTHGMHSGRVYLNPGQECGWHNTDNKEELLVFLSGSGISEIQDKDPFEVGKGKVMYIPPNTEHNIKNSGSEPLEYIFCVAPTKTEGTR